MDNPQSKIKQLAANIKKDRDDSFSKFALALEFMKINDLNKARILFEDIQQKEPGYVGVYYHLGKLYQRLDRGKDAMDIFEKGIDVAMDKQAKRTLSELQEALTELKFEMEE